MIIRYVVLNTFLIYGTPMPTEIDDRFILVILQDICIHNLKYSSCLYKNTNELMHALPLGMYGIPQLQSNKCLCVAHESVFYSHMTHMQLKSDSDVKYVCG